MSSDNSGGHKKRRRGAAPRSQPTPRDTNQGAVAVATPAANAPARRGELLAQWRAELAPAGSLKQTLGRVRAEDFALDVRFARSALGTTAWLDRGHGQRWFGGYSVVDDGDQRSANAATLLPTLPRSDFDALVRLARTRAAEPLESARLREAPTETR